MPSTKTIDLLTIGNTIVDMEFRVSDETLSTLEIEKGAMLLIDYDQKNKLLNQLGKSIHLCNGGSVANSLYVAHLLGMKGHHYGVIGDDSLGTFVKDDYKNQGLSTSFSDTMVSGDTGCCLVFITPDGERSMLTYLGVSAQFKPNSKLNHLVKNSCGIFLEGYLVADEACFETILLPIASMAKNHQTKLMLTLSDAGLVSFFSQRFRELLSLKIDVLFCNHQEALALTQTESLLEAITFFESSVAETVITDGPNGAYIHHQGKTHRIPTKAIHPIDTTGAGDAFAGTYLAKRFKHKSIEASAITAHQVAQLVISQLGARPENVVDYLNSFADSHF